MEYNIQRTKQQKKHINKEERGRKTGIALEILIFFLYTAYKRKYGNFLFFLLQDMNKDHILV